MEKRDGFVHVEPTMGLPVSLIVLNKHADTFSVELSLTLLFLPNSIPKRVNFSGFIVTKPSR